MLRLLLILVSTLAGSCAHDPKRQLALAGAGAIVALAGAVAANIALAAAAFLLLAPRLGPAGAAALSAVIVAVVSAAGIGLLYWAAQRVPGRSAAPARLAGRADEAAVIGTVVSAFLAGLVAGLDRKPVSRPTDRG